MQGLVRVVGLFSVGLALAATGYCAFNYVGPYAWIANLQVELSGSYGLQITFLLTLLAFLLPCLAVMVPLRMAMGQDPGAVNDVALNEWIMENRGSLILGMLSVGLLGTSAYFALDAFSIGERTDLDVAVLEAGGEPASRHVVLSGYLRHDLTYQVTEEHTTRVYVPIVRTTPNQPVVFLETYDTWLDTYAAELSTGRFEGLLYENGLPGLVRDELATHGLVGPRHYTLDYRRSPSERWGMAGTFAAMGALFGVILGVVRAVVFLRRR